MLNKIQLNLILAFLIMYSAGLFAQAGSLDTSFDGDGMRLYDFGETYDNGHGIVTLSDTTAVVLGEAVVNGVGIGVLFKILQNSEIDVTFGEDNGVTEFSYGTGIAAYALGQQSDGKYLAAGIVGTTSSGNNFFLARFLTNGELDTSFGTGGFFISDYSTDNEHCRTLAVQPDGKIVLAGRTYEGSYSSLFFTRVNTDGTLDTSFGNDGYTKIDESIQGERINSIDFLSNGTIVGVGYAYQSSPYFEDHVIMAKIDANGNPITSFGGNGAEVPAVFTDNSFAKKIVIRNDSLFVTGQQFNTNGNSDLFLTKMDSSGVADPTFGTNGIVLTQNSNWNYGFDIILTSDGKIYNSGTTGTSGMASDFIIIRYLPDGSYDNTWDGDGKAITNIRPDWDEAYAMGLQSDGKILVTGMCSGFSTSGDNKIPIVRYNNDYVPFGAIFTSDTIVCEGSSVQFTDQSGGIVTAWDWMFEGGTPPASTLQNPVITYNTEGIYDVQLIVTDNELNSDTLLMEDYIQVITTPGLANQPSGDTEICNGEDHEYTTSSVLYASEYEWEVNPTEAGTMSGTDTLAVFFTSDSWSGDFDIKVRAVNNCGDGDWSDELSGTLSQSPAVFTIEGGGGYCFEGDGSEITLSGSESGVDYELYLNDTPTGNVVAGTDSEISFGYIMEEGFYTAFAENTNCTQVMLNQVEVFLLFPPMEPGTPSGPGTICLEETSDYTSTGTDNADSYVWELMPEEAGVITSDGLNATVDWDAAYSGIALISLYGINECGNGNSSEELEVSVGEPNPQIAGEPLVCDWSDEIYEVAENEGSSYTWEVTGGTVTEGQGTYMATVSWEGEGSGTLLVNEETVDGCEGSSDLFEVVIDDCTGINETGTDNKITIHPNPAGDRLTLSINSSEITKAAIHIYNRIGQQVISNTINLVKGEQEHQFNISQLVNGLYIISIETDNKILYKTRFLKN